MSKTGPSRRYLVDESRSALMNRKQLISQTVRAIMFFLSVLALAGYVEKAEAESPIMLRHLHKEMIR